MNAPLSSTEQAAISLEEAVQLGAVDPGFYSRFFFPKTVRQHVPDMHREMWFDLDDPLARYVAFKVFRDGAKTTILRLFTSRRVAYGVSHTIVYTSNSEGHAVRSLKWLRRQVDYNALWAQAFGLRRGAKWSDQEIEIIHGVDEYPISIIAVGITGQVRGINLDDYRPDLVVADDVDNEETTGTPEQRKKAADLLFGALMNGLAPRSEAVNAKFVLLQTPLADGDLIDIAAKDPSFRAKTFGCFDDSGQSRWESRYPTEDLRKEKQNYIQRNQLSLWMREKECKIVGDEMASFKRDWLKFYDQLPAGGYYKISVDPASADPKAAKTNDTDYWATVVWYFHGRKRFLVDYEQVRGIMPDEFIAKLFTKIFTYHPRQLIVETTAFQKILAWLIRKAMEHYRKWLPVIEHDDKRKKADVILQAYLNVAPGGELYVKSSQVEFIEAFCTWFPGYAGHDDLLDAGARGLIAGPSYDDAESSTLLAETALLDAEVPELEWDRPAP